MLRIAQAFAFAVLTVSTAGIGFAEDKKKEDMPKADVIVENGAKTGTAKAGQLVQVDIHHPVIPPFPSDFEVKVNGKKVDSKTYPGAVLAPNGKPVVGVGANFVQFKAGGEGKQKVVIEYKKGKNAETVEIELEVKK